MTTQKQKTFRYEGKDLDSMDGAVNYHAWILGEFTKFLGASVTEVGAGTGTFSKLVATRPESKKVIMVEPSIDMVQLLENNIKEMPQNIDVELFPNFLSEVEDSVKKLEPDSMVFVNVFEHIENDKEEMKRCHRILSDGGRLCIFVPALPVLYSKFDKSIDHFRRYTRSELRQKVEGAGFKVLENRYFDFPGILPWFIKFKLFGSTSMDPKSVALYDNLAVPVVSKLEKIIHPPVGKNLLLIAEKI